jgi:transcriptional regulator with XRE-family HTH domain
LHPLLRKAQKEALESQLIELRSQLAEYDALRSGERLVLEVSSFDDLPRALIQSRIAAGLSQKELADKLNMKEQQIQRYEATEYASASIERVKEVIEALGISVREEVFLPSAQVSSATLFKRLQEAGFPRDLVIKRMLPSFLAAQLQGKNGNKQESKPVIQAAALISRILRCSVAEILGASSLRLDTLITTGTARFKVPAGANERQVKAYTLYAHHLALLTLQATVDLPKKPIPIDPGQVRHHIKSAYGSISFENALRYVWGLGIPVLPLGDKGTFHGACFRENGRNMIVLKQRTRSAARLLHILIHEYRHAGHNSEQLQRDVIEASETSRERRESREEQICSQFAGEIALDGRAEELVDMCVKESNGKVQLLTSIVPKIATREKVSVGSLANYMAYRLWQDEVANWWGAAENLQEKDGNPWQFARDLFLQHINWGRLSDPDRTLLQQALSEFED